MQASYLWIIPILMLLVFVHELGHFVAARRFGVFVKEFALGFPPRIFAFKRGDTEYSLNALPIGGYVRMEGEDGQLESANSFAAKPRSQRAIILLAGVTMNALIIPILMTVSALTGEPTVAGVVVREVQAASAAQAAGLHSGDVVLAANGAKLDSTQTFFNAIDSNLDKPLVLTVAVNGDLSHTSSVSVTPRSVVPAGQGHLGVSFVPRIVTVSYPFWQAPVIGVQHSVTLVGDFFSAIGQMFKVKAVEVSGPVAITRVTGEAAQQGPGTLLELTALLSLNLAIFNLIPFPGLDGGRLAMLLLEQLRGRSFNPRIEGAINFAGLLVLLTLMVVVSYNDIMHATQ